MTDIIERVQKNLGKLQRNEGQMTEDQRKKYAAPIKKLKRAIAEDATKFMWDFLLSGCRLMERDNDSADWKAFIRDSERLIGEWEKSGGMKKASGVLWKTYDLDAFLAALLPIHLKIWYEAYGPYWLSHCTPTFEDEYTFTNDIIGMEWWDKHNEWAAVKVVDGRKETDYQKGVTIMLPPTKEQLDARYKEDVAGLEAAG